jgi:hypothetical protein
MKGDFKNVFRNPCQLTDKELKRVIMICQRIRMVGVLLQLLGVLILLMLFIVTPPGCDKDNNTEFIACSAK